MKGVSFSHAISNSNGIRRIDSSVLYAELLKLPFPVLADLDRAIYHLYGLDKVLFVIQRTASMVVDRGGVIRYIKRATNPMVWLQDSRELLDFVVGLGGRTP